MKEYRGGAIAACVISVISSGLAVILAARTKGIGGVNLLEVYERLVETLRDLRLKHEYIKFLLASADDSSAIASIRTLARECKPLLKDLEILLSKTPMRLSTA